MPVSFRILPERGLVYVRYDGFARLDDTFAAFGEYARHRDCRPGQKQLVDLAGLTGIEKDYAKLFEMQARKADVFGIDGAQTLIVYHAPTEETYALARLILRSWEPVRSVIPIVQQTEAGALDILGQPERGFAELLERAA